jgi:chemotaxis signal transduction protein
MKQLLLFSLKGKNFAAWKEDVKDIRKIGTLSHLYIDRSGTFDVTLIDDRITYLYDLSVCLGFTSIEKEKKENALIMPAGNEATGFTVEGEIKQISVAPEEAFPIPDYLKTDIINTSIKYGSKLVPVINLSPLHACLQQPEHKMSMPDLRLPVIKRKKTPSDDRFWAFSCCGYFFVVSHGRIETVQVQGENIIKLPFIPC